MVQRNYNFSAKADNGDEYWLLFGAGLNSVTASAKSNYQLRSLTVLAHAKGMKVMGLTPTPWGTDGNAKFRGLAGLTRRRATQHVADYVLGRLTPQQALRAMTIDAAWQLHLEASRGSIEVGKLADFALLDANPLDDSSAIRDIEVLSTYVGGERV